METELLCIWKQEGYRPDITGKLKFKNIFIPYRMKTNPKYKDWDYRVIHKIRNELVATWGAEGTYESYMSGEPSSEDIREQIMFMFECEDYFED